MDSPLISVIIPVFNTGELLRSAVQSVLEQSLRSWELVLVDDGSTDTSTSELCRELSSLDPRIRLFRTPNGGVSAARNFGLSQSRGEWITYMDSDDMLHPDALRLLHQAAGQHAAAMAVAPLLEVTPDNIPPTVRLRPEVKVVDAETLVKDVLYQRGPINNSACGRLFRRSVALAVPFPEGVYYEDLATFHRFMFRAGKIAVLSTPLYYYLQHGASYTHTFSPRRAVVLDVTAKVAEELRDTHPELLPAANSRSVSAAFNILRLMRANHYRDEALRSRCRAIIRSHRAESLADPNVRMKNRLALLASYTPLFHLL